MKKFMAVVVIALVTVVVLAGCQPVTPQEAESQYCTDLAAVKTAAEQVKALNADSTIDEAQAAIQELGKAMETAAISSVDVKEAQWDAIDEAFKTMQQDINDISGSDTVGEASQVVAEAQATFAQAVNESLTINCGDVMTPTAASN